MQRNAKALPLVRAFFSPWLINSFLGSCLCIITAHIPPKPEPLTSQPTAFVVLCWEVVIGGGGLVVAFVEDLFVAMGGVDDGVGGCVVCWFGWLLLVGGVEWE